MEHQSATFFERCHATDADPRATVAQRHACWTAWVDYYAQEQPPEQVRYAEGRCDALARGESLPPLPGLGPSVDETYTASYLALSVDTQPEDVAVSATTGDAGATTPSTEAAASLPADADIAHADRTPAPPSGGTSACSTFCVPRWDTCMARCDDQGRGCRGACETHYRTCLGGCY